MELLHGDRRTSSPTDFPQHISPFLATGDLLVSVSNPTAFIQSPDDDINFPPQKLRPIRASCSSFTVAGGDMEQLGGEVSEYLESLGKGEDADVAVQSGGGQCGVGVVDGSVGVDSGKSGESGDPNWEGGLLKEESSSSSDDDDADNLSTGTKDNRNRKRKWKERKMIEEFLESLVLKVMEKQEQMHKQLIEMIEGSERERVIREEAWKQQEMERMKRDEEIRAQEISRNLAVISFIQNLMDAHGIEAPKPLTTAPISPVGNNGGEGPVRNEFKSKPSNGRWPEAELQSPYIASSFGTKISKYGLQNPKYL